MKKIAFFLFTLPIFGAGCITSSNIDVKVPQENQQQKIIDDQAEIIHTLEKKVEDLSESQQIKKQQPVTKKPVDQNNLNVKKEIQTENLDSILLNYKIDSQEYKDSYLSLINIVNNNSATACSSIIANKTTGQHLYYHVINNLNTLENKYGVYKEKIEYIDNNLYGLWYGIQIVKDKCASVQFEIE